jgi:dsRNA-specific ribonuclease
MHPPNRELSNYKGILQKQCQTFLSADPNYRVISESGPSHKRTFEMEVWVNNRRLGSAVGRSKKEAEQKAALVSIKYFETDEFKIILKELENEKPKKKKRSHSQKRNARRASQNNNNPT